MDMTRRSLLSSLLAVMASANLPVLVDAHPVGTAFDFGTDDLTLAAVRVNGLQPSTVFFIQRENQWVEIKAVFDKTVPKKDLEALYCADYVAMDFGRMNEGLGLCLREGEELSIVPPMRESDGESISIITYLKRAG